MKGFVDCMSQTTLEQAPYIVRDPQISRGTLKLLVAKCRNADPESNMDIRPLVDFHRSILEADPAGNGQIGADS